jgi:formylglycine-generating enzyme required for sulfatase activity
MFMFQYPSNPGGNGQTVLGPARKADAASWLAGLQISRTAEITYRAFDGAEYDRPELKWTQRAFVQTLAMVEDRYLFDPGTGRWTVDRFLDDLEARYGGIDCVLLWMMYPNIGVDDRNQFDHLRDLPGGVAGVRQLVADFHRRNVRVIFPIKPWDIGTRDEGEPMWTAWARLIKAIGADGLNGDTCFGVPHAYKAAADAIGKPMALEPENGLAWEESALVWNLMTWGYWQHPPVPSVSRYKWTEPRHMVHLCDRWSRSKTNLLQAALFNGTGIETWENVWGIWNGMTPRDGEATRRIMTIQRALAGLLVSREWEPHAATVQEGVYASRWPNPGKTLWTLVNRNEFPVAGIQLRVPHAEGRRYYDLWHGQEVYPPIEAGQAAIGFDFEPAGYGVILSTDVAVPGLDALLARMGELSRQPLTAFSAEWQPLRQEMVLVAETKRLTEPPPGMVRIPGGSFEFRVSGIMIEGDNNAGVGVQFPWEDVPSRHHAKVMDVGTFHIDRHPVTNAQFKVFLDATAYQPKDTHNFLRDWPDRSIPVGWENRPVTWVSLGDAHAYAAWAGKRLPHDWEWQYAAGGGDGRAYPWGNEWDASCVPPAQTARTCPPPVPVGLISTGASPFGVMDLVGHVWQWTDEFHDDHTRAALVRGGSHYQPSGSHWYFPQAYRLDQHGKYLLVSPSRDRAGTIGFRCVVDVA